MRNLLKDQRGLAAVEFALITSLFLLPLFLGMLEVVTLYHVQAKVAALAGYTAEMVSTESPGTASSGIYTLPATGTSSTSLQDICNGALKSMAPYPVNNMTINIASVTQESGPAGLPTTNAKVHTAAASYDVWEQDFTVSGTSCNAASTLTIGSANAISLATTNPPTTFTGGPSALAMINVPCDNAIIVTATVPYPGPIGKILLTRPTLTATSYSRWGYDSTENELETSGTSKPAVNAATQVCNSTNTATN
jgi:Flp pilus assembly protein TadG